MAKDPLNYRLCPPNDVVEMFRRGRFRRRGKPVGCKFACGAYKGPGDKVFVGEPLAAILVSRPVAHWSKPVTELRFCTAPTVPYNMTEFIHFAEAEIVKRGLPGLVVAYTETPEEYLLAAYRRAGYHYHDLREPENDGLLLIPARSTGIEDFSDRSVHFVAGPKMNHSFARTRSGAKFQRDHPEFKVRKHMSEAKHVVWKALTAKAYEDAENLKQPLRKLSYP